MKTLHIILVNLFILSSCNNNQVKPNVMTKSNSIDSTYFCLEDSITVRFLSQTNYKKAIATCRLTLLDKQIILKGHGYMGPTRILANYYSREEHERNNIPIKIVQWGTKDEEHIIYVWYRKEKKEWQPIVAEKYHISTQF